MAEIVILGVSTAGGAFTPEILQQMAKNCERPMIFAISNPTSKAECTAQQAYDNTEGRCIFCSGSPFPPVKFNGVTYYTGQGNNSYIFPGVALGIIAGHVTVVSNKMFLTAAKTVASMCTEADYKVGRVYPPLSDIKNISIEIAKNVIEEAYKDQMGGVFPKPRDLARTIQANLYELEYPCYAPNFYEYQPNCEFKVQTVKEYMEHKKKANK